ncbi:MAG: sigma-70 family RNA polymerase sigma factor [Verrucomicrobiales bacterium]|nr:sigma-70 family RNA polymerase sigma factor [Verrucomicrobiales bacterium]
MQPLPIKETDPSIELLIDQHREQLYGFVLSLVANNSDAEDLLQQVCLILWEKKDTFEPGANFLAWARKIARYQALNHWRKEQNRPQETLLDEHLIQVVHERTGERELEFARHRRALQFCIKQLPDRQRQVVEAHYFEEKSIPEIAELFSIKPNAVSQLLFRARAGLIACVKSRSKGITDEDLT